MSETPNYKLERCGVCGQSKLREHFMPVGEQCPFQKDGYGIVCYDCIAKSVEFNDLDAVDRLMQFLNMPFLANEWIGLCKKCSDKRVVLEEYTKLAKSEDHKKKNWKTYTLVWDKIREMNNVMAELPELEKDLLVYLKKKWGEQPDFTTEDYVKMEAYEKNTTNYYNFRDEARRDMIRKLALVSAMIDKKFAEGDSKEASNLISSYQTLMKESGIQNAVHNETETIESLSELIAFLEENNWMMDYRVTESRDVVDATIRNFQQYVAALVSGSGEEINQMYQTKLIEEQSGTMVTEEEIETLFETPEENEMLDEEALNEEELIEMFKEISSNNAKK